MTFRPDGPIIYRVRLKPWRLSARPWWGRPKDLVGASVPYVIGDSSSGSESVTWRGMVSGRTMTIVRLDSEGRETAVWPVWS